MIRFQNPAGFEGGLGENGLKIRFSAGISGPVSK
jgi:hypothetical protein